ncbi:pirin family protein [Sphingobacterium oryzagri]|uniref:Pirin family protein n=1 Tax=Sphingobacterium oryzagri TaxID=3025669 RepID=A0ABY7WFF5_9SPHI|nr:pirin family protein [Sphingobacterium sp. KACC 22765]WDF67344.1 pirin family protein [Sphingobacterium sp. KACC 22765]
MANYIFHAADSRGSADHGWLQSKHTFSFANYFNPERMQFGVLRVLNDDHVAAGQGFGAHPHDNMEIISIPLAGDLEHKDSIGNVKVIRSGDIQVMSAGTGVTHSEYNKNSDRDVKFLQIWVYPNKRNVSPRYDQLSLNPADRVNKFQQILSPNPADEGVWIHQDAWFSLGNFDAGVAQKYTFKGEHTGLYIFNLSGELLVDGYTLQTRDGLAITALQEVTITAKSAAEFLLMEVSMQS